MTPAAAIPSTVLNRSTAQVLGALIKDTFQEARARWLFWGLFSLSTLLILVFLFALNIDLAQGAVSFMDIQSTTRTVDIPRFVHASYSWVSTFLYLWGTLLAIFASSGLVPSVLEPGRISLLLSKPVPRTTLLVGRYLGNLLIIAANHAYLILSVWLILGAKTQIWDGRFLLALPVTVFVFAVLLTTVVLVGVVAESAALSVMVAVALMLISAVLAQRQIVVKLLSSEWSRKLWQGFYWMLPKVYDLGNGLRQIIALDRDADLSTPVWTSALFAAVVFVGAILVFRRRDF